MENNDKNLQEQQAPLKNTDDAFVQVGKDGEPVMPQNADDKNHSESKDEKVATSDKR